MIYLSLFWEFFKTGLFSVGGGLAAIPFLQQMSESYGWFTMQELADMIAVAESTPGPIGINMATYIGNRVGGVPGAILATLAFVLPSFLLMLVIARVIKKYQQNRFVQAAFSGLRPASMGLILSAATTLLFMALFPGFSPALFALTTFHWPSLLLFGFLFTLLCIKKIKLHPLAYIAFAAIIGIVFSF